MFLHLDCRAAKPKLLIELSILEGIDWIVDYSPKYSTQIERNANWPRNGWSKRCIANEDARVKCDTKDSLWVGEITLGCWIEKDERSYSETKLDAFPGELEQDSKVKSHQARQEEASLERSKLTSCKGTCLCAINMLINISIREVIDNASSTSAWERSNSKESHSIQIRNQSRWAQCQSPIARQQEKMSPNLLLYSSESQVRINLLH